LHWKCQWLAVQIHINTHWHTIVTNNSHYQLLEVFNPGAKYLYSCQQAFYNSLQLPWPGAPFSYKGWVKSAPPAGKPLDKQFNWLWNKTVGKKLFLFNNHATFKVFSSMEWAGKKSKGC
jgi:hypothetical protein